jgi:hypothetical protein
LLLFVQSTSHVHSTSTEFIVQNVNWKGSRWILYRLLPKSLNDSNLIYGKIFFNPLITCASELPRKDSKIQIENTELKSILYVSSLWETEKGGCCLMKECFTNYKKWKTNKQASREYYVYLAIYQTQRWMEIKYSTFYWITTWFSIVIKIRRLANNQSLFSTDATLIKLGLIRRQSYLY